MFSLNSCSLNLFKVERDESYKITAYAQKAFTARCIPCIHMHILVHGIDKN